MIFRRKYSVPNICCPCWIQATHACHSQVAHRFLGLWSPRRFVVVSFDAGPMFPCNKNHRNNEHMCLRKPCLFWNLSLLFLPEAWDPWERQHTSPAHYGCIILAKDEVVVSKMCTTGYWLWSRLFSICECCTSMKNCRDWAFSLWVGREAVSLSAADVRNMWRSAKQNLSDMLRHVCCRNPFQSFLFGVPSIHSLPEAWGSWEP